MKRIVDVTAGKMKTLSLLDVTAREPTPAHPSVEAILTDVPEGDDGKLVERRVRKTKTTKVEDTDGAK